MIEKGLYYCVTGIFVLASAQAGSSGDQCDLVQQRPYVSTAKI